MIEKTKRPFQKLRIWFFEMLRRVAEEPAALPEDLPAWFLDALDKLEKAKKPTEPAN